MPIISRTNNRVLPPNARTADVARETLNRAIPIQNRKTDAAYQVNGYGGVLYSYLTSGLKCACQAKAKAVNTRLDKEGKASPEAINEMLTTSGGFGIRPYAQRKANTPAYAEQRAQRGGILEVNLTGHSAQPVSIQSLFDHDDLQGANRYTDGRPDIIDFDPDNTSASLLVEHDTSTDVRGLITDFDTSLLGHSDVNCPICFGSGYVGGYDVLHGYRKVLNFQDKTIILPATALIAVEKDIPTLTTDRVSWNVTLPAGSVGVDAFRIWNDVTQVSGFKVTIDGHLISSDNSILGFCDGKVHLLAVQFNQEVTFTHLELQVNQSDFSANFELPKLSKGSTQSLRDATEAFTISLSPRVPTIKTLDVIVESTFHKALQVKTVTGLNDRHFTTMGWEVDVRPTQPQELFSLLPRRKPLESMNTRRMVISNPNPT